MSKLNTSELRPGNLVKTGNGIFKVFAVSAIQVLAVQNVRAEPNSEHQVTYDPVIKGIPWNELDYMEELGFDYAVGYTREIDEQNKMRLMAADGLLYPVIEQWPTGSSVLQMVELPPIKYIHQLQNVWYAVTGTELDLSKILTTTA